jgi:hypothetical protein
MILSQHKIKLGAGLAVIAAALLSGCASSHPYQLATTENGVGRSSSVISPDRFRITYTSNTKTSKADAQDYALLSAAEMSIEEGSPGFYIVASETESLIKYGPVSASHTPGRSTTTYRSCGIVFCETRVNEYPDGWSQYTYSSQSGLIGYSQKRYQVVLEIKLAGKDAAQAANLYDAQAIVNSLRPRLIQEVYPK